MSRFVNRIDELNLLKESTAGLTLVFGRRRIGKTTLIERWGKQQSFFYSQAIEGGESIQISQLLEDLAGLVPAGLKASSWAEFLPILSLIRQKCVIALDEFPYLVKSQPSLPSRLQKWLDHDRPKNLRLVLLGSSQTMMNGLFLNSKAPLYERADLILHLQPMGYRFFCEALGADRFEVSQFEKYSLVGGVPRYWASIDPKDSVIAAAERLFFSRFAQLESEPDRLLKDEDISGMQAKSIFECIGRGAHKPSEIAARMGIGQTALSKPMQILLQTSLIKRSLPFGENTRSSKRTLYSIADYALMFWYGGFSPHRSRWHTYSDQQKSQIIHNHASSVLEDCYRNSFPDGSRYWDGQMAEFDCVRHAPGDSTKLIITEIKHREIKASERAKLRQEIVKKFEASKLASNYELADIEVFSTSEVLSRL